jgi:hypothetical protein
MAAKIIFGDFFIVTAKNYMSSEISMDLFSADCR